MLFFQALLLAGYAYAHCLTRKLAASARRRIAAHRAARSPRSPLLPIAPRECVEAARRGGADHRILLLLWRDRRAAVLPARGRPARCCRPGSRAPRPGEDPYRLFAVSNLASLLALVGYPFVVEPFLDSAASR